MRAISASDVELPVDPWVLGALLGDGDLTQTTIRFSTGGRRDARASGRARRADVRARACRRPRLSDRAAASRPPARPCRHGANPLTPAIRALGLWGRRSHEKFIPRRVSRRRASAAPRRAARPARHRRLGRALGNGALRHEQPRARRDVVELVRSLGGWCTLQRKRTSFTVDGVRREGRECFVSTIHHPGAADAVPAVGQAGAKAAKRASPATDVRVDRAVARRARAVHLGQPPIASLRHRRLRRHAQHGARHQHGRERRAQHRHAGRDLLDGDGRDAARAAHDRQRRHASTSTSCAPAASPRTTGTSCRPRSDG